MAQHMGYAQAMTDEPGRHEREEAERRTALKSLDRLRHEGDSLFGSALAGAGRRAADHFSAKDATDPVELWGRRIGRALSLAAFIALCVYLYLTYLR
jgi:hypothetical protein